MAEVQDFEKSAGVAASDMRIGRGSTERERMSMFSETMNPLVTRAVEKPYIDIPVDDAVETVTVVDALPAVLESAP